MLDYKVLENVGALEEGVLILGCDIEAELAKMTPADARTAKRKYRKLRRKAAKDWSPRSEREMPKKAEIRYIRMHLQRVGQAKLGG